MTPDWIGAFVVGLIGAGHCMGMCGGIASILSIGAQKPSPITPVLYNFGTFIKLYGDWWLDWRRRFVIRTT